MNTQVYSDNLKEKPLGRNICMQENNIRTDIKETDFEDVDWIYQVFGWCPVEASFFKIRVL